MSVSVDFTLLVKWVVHSADATLVMDIDDSLELESLKTIMLLLDLQKLRLLLILQILCMPSLVKKLL